jgi:ABC-2 type transport system ATP-binding protein
MGHPSLVIRADMGWAGPSFGGVVELLASRRAGIFCAPRFWRTRIERLRRIFDVEVTVALTITGLSKTYPNGVKALKNLSLSIGNSMFGLVGPNGAGKSSLMRTVATLQEPDSGSIHLDGIDVLRQKDEVRRVLGYLPQEFGVYPKISALDMLHHLAVMKGMNSSGERKETVDALLQQTNLWDVRKKALSTFSGGMKQRFGIAQALLGNPRLIIVDEPTAGLDPAERNRFLNLLSSLGSDRTVILSTHIVDDVRQLCPRMAIIAAGELLLEGAPNDTLAALNGKIWSKVVATDDELHALEAQHQVISTHLVGGQHEIRVYAESSPGAGFRSVDSGLEDVYFLNLSQQAKGRLPN